MRSDGDINVGDEVQFGLPAVDDELMLVDEELEYDGEVVAADNDDVAAVLLEDTYGVSIRDNKLKDDVTVVVVKGRPDDIKNGEVSRERTRRVATSTSLMWMWCRFTKTYRTRASARMTLESGR